MHFTITSEHTKMRLDKFLKEHWPEFSRAQLQKLIAAEAVKVNGQKVAPHYFLRAGDKVEAVVQAPEELEVKANEAIKVTAIGRHPEERSDEGSRPSQEPRDSSPAAQNDEIVVEVIHEELDFIVINKPAGLVVHQGEGHKAPDTLVNGLLARYPEIARVGEDPMRPGIVHRLDADVSGVMVVARTPDMFEHLKKQFKQHAVEKEYIAVVQGKVSPPEGVIEFPIARKGARMVARPKKLLTPHPSPLPQEERGRLRQEGKRAVTEYETMKRVAEVAKVAKVTMLRIATRTGRMHQIRVHLKAIGHPIVGDTLYRSKLSKVSKLSEESRLMLYARKLAFKDLKGERREFVVGIPSDFLNHES